MGVPEQPPLADYNVQRQSEGEVATVKVNALGPYAGYRDPVANLINDLIRLGKPIQASDGSKALAPDELLSLTWGGRGLKSPYLMQNHPFRDHGCGAGPDGMAARSHWE